MSGGGGFGHAFVPWGANEAEDDSPHSNYLPGLCFEEHPSCRQDEEITDGTLAQVLRGTDAEAIERLIDTHPKQLHLIAGRRAVQVTGCGGQIVAHFVLSESAAAGLID